MKKKWGLTAAFILALLLSTVAGTQFVNLGQANPFRHESKKEGDVPTPEGTLPPTILILSPENNTAYASHTVSLTLNVSMPQSNNVSLRISEIYYKASWLSDGNGQLRKNQVNQGSINLTDIPEGPRWLEVYAVANGFAYYTRDEINRVSYIVTSYYVDYIPITGSSFVKFTIDTNAPSLLSLSVENKTYSTSNVTLNVLVNEPVSQVIYSLDEQANVTAARNTTLTDLPDGEHKLTVWVRDLAGNAGNSETIYFSVDAPEPFPTELAITASGASVAIVGVGLLFYFKKRHVKSGDKT